MAKTKTDGTANCRGMSKVCPSEAGTQLPVLQGQRTRGVWHHLQMDCIDLLPTTKEEYKYLLVIIDLFSAWTEAFPTWVNTAAVAGKKLYEEIFCRYSTAQIMGSDRWGDLCGRGP